MANSGDRKAPHVALVVSAGMGHVGSMSLLAAELSNRGCNVTFVSAQPTVSQAETNRISQLLTSFPTIQSLNLPLADVADVPPNTDPFFRRFEAIIRSADRLPPLLASSDVSALILDISVAFTYLPVAKKMNLPCYILAVSASMTALCAYFPTYLSTIDDDAPIGDVDINGVFTIPKASVLPVLSNRRHLFTKQFIENGRCLTQADGIILNTFDSLEPEVISGLRSGKIVPDLPPVVAIGPQITFQSDSMPLPAWLDRQPEGSVVYVSFGNRSVMTWEQTRELGLGLEMSGCRFLWVVKLTVVDRDEGEKDRLNEVLGEGYLERVKDRGMVVNEWVEQTEALRHKAVGGFFSHCGWNSVTESAMLGMRMLGWPRGGDHRVGGGVTRRSGLGIWMEEWPWDAEGGLVGREEIAKAVKAMMENETLRLSAARLGEEAAKAVAAGGSSDKGMDELVSKLKGAIANL